MSDEQGTIRSVAWREVFPWLSLTRAVRLSLRARMLTIATVGVLATIGGWWLIGLAFSGSEDLKPWIESYGNCPWSNHGHYAPSIPHLLSAPTEPPADMSATADGNPLEVAWANLSAPARQLFNLTLSLQGLAYLLLNLFWVVGVWAYFGGALSRTAAMQLGREEGISLGAALKHARSKWLSYFASPLLPLIGVLLLSLPLIAMGLLLKFGFGVLIAAVLWPFVLIAGLLMAIILLGLLFGWPLMWSAIGTEGTDSFDALSRSYSYVFQRPMHYLGYAVFAALLGVLASLLVDGFAAGVVYLADWATSWGSGRQDSVSSLLSQEGLEGMKLWGKQILRFWQGCVRLVTIGFVYSYFFSAATQIYLLLRYDTDGTEIDEVYVEDSEEAFGLPHLKTDAAGVPTVANEPKIPGSGDQPAENS